KCRQKSEEKTQSDPRTTCANRGCDESPMGRQESSGRRYYAKHFDRTRVYTGTGPSTAVKRRSGDAACQAVRCRSAEAQIFTLASRFISTKYLTRWLNIRQMFSIAPSPRWPIQRAGASSRI